MREEDGKEEEEALQGKIEKRRRGEWVNAEAGRKKRRIDVSMLTLSLWRLVDLYLVLLTFPALKNADKEETIFAA